MSKNNNCIFCNPTNILINGEYAYSRLDGFPVSEGHCLVIPKRHVISIDELADVELKDLYTILYQTKIFLRETYQPDGFNIGINEGINLLLQSIIWIIVIFILGQIISKKALKKAVIQGG